MERLTFGSTVNVKALGAAIFAYEARDWKMAVILLASRRVVLPLFAVFLSLIAWGSGKESKLVYTAIVSIRALCAVFPP